jgi:hypothetical protein
MDHPVTPFRHNLQAGDHVFRWTSIVIYPIQVHGIVLSTGEGIVTIVDFGLTAPPPKSKDETHVDRDVDKVVEQCQSYHQKVVTDDKLSDMQDQLRRFSIVILSEEKEIKQWKRVDYGEIRINTNDDSNKDTNKRSWWPWFSHNDSIRLETVAESSSCSEDDPMSRSSTERQPDSNEDKTCTTNLPSSQNIINPSTNKLEVPPSRSDPTFLVLARVRFLMMHPETLPPHHVIYSNSGSTFFKNIDSSIYSNTVSYISTWFFLH